VTEHYQPTNFERWALRGAIGVLVGVVGWIGVTAIEGQQQTATAVSELSRNVAVMQAQMTALTSNVNDVRALTNTVAQMQVTQAEHERRLTDLEHDKQASASLKRWTH
jgi:hypothetical protein